MLPHVRSTAAPRVSQTSQTPDPAPFYYGNSPGATAPPRGKKMCVSHLDTEKLTPVYPHDKFLDDEAAKATLQKSTFDRNMGASDAAYRGKRMFGEGAHKANAYLFVEYGSFDPPKPRPYGQVRDNNPEKLAGYIHPGHDQQRAREMEKISTSPSLFDKNLADRDLDGFYKVREVSESVLSEKRAQRGLLDGIVNKSDDISRHAGKKMLRHDEGVLAKEPLPIPGFAGVGVGQQSRLERIPQREKKDMMPPMQPHFGTHHDAKYGVHGFTTCPPAPAEDERTGWFNWTEDRQKCPVTDAGFDPLQLKETYCSPGDPLNHPQRLKRIDLGTPQTYYLLHNQAGSAPKDRVQCVKMFERNRSPTDQLVPGFPGFGNPQREEQNKRAQGMRKIEPTHWEPRSRNRSALDYV